MKTNEFLFAANTAEMMHRTGIEVHDPFPYLRLKNGSEYAILDAREYEIIKKKLKENKSNIVLEKFEDYVALAQAKSKKDKKFSKLGLWQKVILLFLKSKKIKDLSVSENVEAKLFLFLKNSGFKVALKNFSLERRKKSKVEIEKIQQSQQKTEEAFRLVKTILQDSTIKEKNIFWKGEKLTSEILKFEIKKFLLEKNMECSAGIIVAGQKNQSSVAHDTGSGDILANELIIVDIFPKDTDTGYFGDMTRTFLKGEPNKEQLKIYNDVKTVQEKVLDFVKLGVGAKEIYNFTVTEFAKLGHKTDSKNGFTHGLGHSLGLLIHEYFPVAGMGSAEDQKIEIGDVLTIEPGLYYEKIGGVRIEDIVYINEKGETKNMNKFEKVLVIE